MGGASVLAGNRGLLFVFLFGFCPFFVFSLRRFAQREGLLVSSPIWSPKTRRSAPIAAEHSASLKSSCFLHGDAVHLIQFWRSARYLTDRTQARTDATSRAVNPFRVLAIQLDGRWILRRGPSIPPVKPKCSQNAVPTHWQGSLIFDRNLH